MVVTIHFRQQPLNHHEDLIRDLHLKKKLREGKKLLNTEWLLQNGMLALNKED